MKGKRIHRVAKGVVVRLDNCAGSLPVKVASRLFRLLSDRLEIFFSVALLLLAGVAGAAPAPDEGWGSVPDGSVGPVTRSRGANGATTPACNRKPGGAGRLPAILLSRGGRYGAAATYGLGRLTNVPAENTVIANEAGGDRPTSGQMYTTTFDGGENPLSENGKWIHNGLDWTRIRKSGGIAYGTQTGTNKGVQAYDDSYAHLSGFPPDQEAWGEVRIAKPDSSCNQELEILLRWTSSAHNTTGYECFARCTNDGSSYVNIVRWDGPLGKFTYLAEKRGPEYGLKNGDILKASVVDNVITVYINGVEKARAKDDTHKTGNPGIGEFLRCPDGRGIGSNTDFGFTSFTARGIAGD